jgi:hypothetical protein
MITFKKIDRRYNGGNWYKYMVSFTHDSLGYVGAVAETIQEFNQVRQWCIDTWGPSCELHDAWAISPTSGYPIWAWETDNSKGKRAIYLKTEQECILAKLRWN